MAVDIHVAQQLLNKKKAVRQQVYALSKYTIQHALKVLKESAVSSFIDAVYVYGSCARKDQHYGSDVDLFIVFKEDFDSKKYHNELISLSNMIQPESSDYPEVDAKFEIGNNWKYAKDLYYSNIRKEGINIWKI